MPHFSKYSNLFLYLFSCSILIYACDSESSASFQADSEMQTVVVEPGHEGFIFRPNSTGVETDVPYREGSYEIALDEEMLQYSIMQDTADLDKDFHFENGTSFNIKARVFYHVSKGRASVVHLKFGRNFEIAINDWLEDSCKDQLSKFDLTVINLNTIGRLEPKIAEHLRDIASIEGFSIEYVEIENLESLF